MGPKKRDQQVLEEPKSQVDQAQADHELFLQAFEKPTQIYRYLRTRNLISPIFLHRSLSYMRERCSRKANTRENFKVDNILKRVESEHKKDAQEESYKSQYMNLMFTGFFDEGSTKSAAVETILKKVSHKKRKDATSPMTNTVVGTVSVPCNPTGSTNGEVVSVSSDMFHHSHGTAVRSYELLIRVTHKHLRPVIVSQPIPNGAGDSDDTDLDVRPQKRRRSNRIPDDNADDEVILSPHVSAPRQQEEVTSVSTAQLVVYDQHLHRLLTDGDYEVVLQEVSDQVTSCGRSRASWETISGHCDTGAFEVFHKSPTLKFRLAWGSEAMQGSVDCTSLFPRDRDHRTDRLDRVNNHLATDHVTSKSRRDPPSSASVVDRRCSLPRGARDGTGGARDGAGACGTRSKRVFYQFLYSKNARRQTEARDNNQCPWCGIDCRQLYPLMRHLRSCHPRLSFTYALRLNENQKGARIDVSVNESYDGSYAGNPQDIRSYIGYAFSRNGPVRRTPVTYVLVYKPLKTSRDMYEFADEESEAPATRQIVQGHDRLYYHPVTCQPVRPCEIEFASVDKNDPEWLRQKTIHLLDDFTDVNEGEKEVMKMWNLHIMNHNYIGDCSLPKACAMFIQEYGETIITKNLFHNFLLHVVNLFDFGLVRHDTVTRTMMQLYWLQHRLATQPTGKGDGGLQENDGVGQRPTCSSSS